MNWIYRAESQRTSEHIVRSTTPFDGEEKTTIVHAVLVPPGSACLCVNGLRITAAVVVAGLVRDTWSSGQSYDATLHTTTSTGCFLVQVLVQRRRKRFMHSYFSLGKK